MRVFSFINCCSCHALFFVFSGYACLLIKSLLPSLEIYTRRGWKFTAVAEVKQITAAFEKPSHLYLGSLPSYALHSSAPVVRTSMTGLVAHMRVHDGSNPFADALPQMPQGSVKIFGQAYQLSILDLVSKGVERMRLSNKATSAVELGAEIGQYLANPRVTQALLQISAGSTSAILQSCAFQILGRLLPSTSVETVEAQAAAAGLMLISGKSGNTPSIFEALLRRAGQALQLDPTVRGVCSPGLECRLLSLLRSMAVSSYGNAKEDATSKQWSSAVGAYIQRQCQRVFELLQSLRDAAAPVPEEDSEIIFGLLAFLGGVLPSIYAPGAKALYSAPDALTEPCTILGPAQVPAGAADLLWKDLNSFGDAVAVCLDSSPNHQSVVPVRNLRFLDTKPDDALFSVFLAEHVGAEALCRVLESVVSIDAGDARPVLGLITSAKEYKQVIESLHNYKDNAKDFKEVVFDSSVNEIKISFDPRCATEKGCDYLTFFKDKSHSSYWGRDKYSGDRGTECWQEVLVIPASSFVLGFVSDRSKNDWGKLKNIFRINPKAI